MPVSLLEELKPDSVLSDRAFPTRCRNGELEPHDQSDRARVVSKEVQDLGGLESLKEPTSTTGPAQVVDWDLDYHASHDPLSVDSG